MHGNGLSGDVAKSRDQFASTPSPIAVIIGAVSEAPPTVDSGDELENCPIPLAHRRLRDAHLLWHQALACYHDAERFRANLNATIEALRNVTFALQKERDAFEDFDAWYTPWQARLKADPKAKWLHDARVTVVHQGDLESYSYAEVRLVTYSEHIVSKIEIPIQTPASVVLRNPSVLGVFNDLKTKSIDPGEAALYIERRWSTQNLDGEEILSALAHVYGLLADLVLDGHIHLGSLDCISAETPHVDFPSSTDRTGKLRCMMAGAETRTEIVRFSDHQELVPASKKETVTKVDAEAVIAHYGFDPRHEGSAVQNLDPVQFAERTLSFAKRVLRRDKHHDWMMFIRDGEGNWHQHSLFAQDRTEKHLLMQMAARFVEERGCDALVEVGEVWTASVALDQVSLITEVEKVPGRGEALAVIVATREGLVRQYETPFRRGPFGGIKLEETRQLDRPALRHLLPVFEVWRKQKFFRAPDGRQSMVWEPSPLDLCPCGGSKRFGECCRPTLDDFDSKGAGERVSQAVSQGDFAEAEKLARARLAQYVIWVRQHTAAAIHMGKAFYDQIVQVDALALESLVESMLWVLTSVKKTEEGAAQLQRLRDVVGVPRLAMRIAAITARWLFQTGHPEEAVLALDALGDPHQLNDSLAIALAVRHFDLNDENRERLLERAIAVAAADEEKQLARLNMASHLAAAAKEEKALALIQTVLDETTDAPSSAERSNALILRWKITSSEEDFPAALAEIKKETDVDSQIRNGIYLIDHAKYAEAEEVLAPFVESGNVTCKLLLTDSRLRRGEKGAALEIFNTIQIEDVKPRLRYPYAHAMSLLALAGFRDLKDAAVELLKALPLAGGEPDKEVASMLAILRAV